MQSQLVFERFEKAHLRTLRKQLLHSGYAGGANPERRGEASREGICPGKVFEILHKNLYILVLFWRRLSNFFVAKRYFRSGIFLLERSPLWPPNLSRIDGEK